MKLGPGLNTTSGSRKGLGFCRLAGPIHLVYRLHDSGLGTRVVNTQARLGHSKSKIKIETHKLSSSLIRDSNHLPPLPSPPSAAPTTTVHRDL
ncbi:hypothetical protein ACS0TY_030201 [Phlomoides rotata]